MSLLGLIPARGGSKGLPRKNLALLNGRPLIAWTIEEALLCEEIERLVVSTDDEEIAQVARQYGAEVPFLRPSDLARDETPSIAVVEHALNWLRVHQSYVPEHVLLLQPTSPLRTAADIREAVTLVGERTADAVVSVCAALNHPYLVHRLDEDGQLAAFVESTATYPRRQGYPAAYAENGAIFLVQTSVLLRERKFVPPRAYPYVMPPERSIDIDTPLDLHLAEFLMGRRDSAGNAPSNAPGRSGTGQEGFSISGRPIGPEHAPLVVAEIGINHEGDMQKALQMVDDASAAGCECVKFQSHVIEDEMIPNDVVPGNTEETIWEVMSRCALSEADEGQLKEYVESKGMIFLSTPFSRAAAMRLERMGVEAYKIGSGECNNYPLVRHIAARGKPVILSTGMNDLQSITPAVEILRAHEVPFALLHCTSIYPTPFELVNLKALKDLKSAYPDAVLGLSDHSMGIYTCLAAVALGASILEKHFVSDRGWPGPDVPISLNPVELADLVRGSRAVHAALGGRKRILMEEQPTINFAYACVVATRDIEEGELLSEGNVWVKRPGTGEIKARDYERILGRKARSRVPKNAQLRWSDCCD